MGEECRPFIRARGKGRDNTRVSETVTPSILDTCEGVVTHTPRPIERPAVALLSYANSSRLRNVSWVPFSGVHTGSQLRAGAGKDLGTEHMPFPGRKSW